eukprot:gene20917-51676_t
MARRSSLTSSVASHPPAQGSVAAVARAPQGGCMRFFAREGEDADERWQKELA